MEEFERITLQIRELRMQQAPETKLGWYIRYLPMDDRDGYNDYRLSLKQSTMSVEESKESDKGNQESAVKEKIEEEVDLNTFFN